MATREQPGGWSSKRSSSVERVQSPLSCIPLASIIGDLEPTACKLHCAVWNGENQPVDVLARSWDEWTGWNSWRGVRDDFNRRFVFSMAQTRDAPTLWLFGGVFEVVGSTHAPNSHAYAVEFRADLLGSYVRRLKIDYLPSGRHVRGLLFELAIAAMAVAEVLPVAYTGEPFPGHDQISHTLGQLEVVYRQQRSDWRGALEHMKGVYVIHDKTSGKPYVGSAYGDTGLWARWSQYVESLHGGNIDLRALVGRQGDEYVRENLVFALLEFWSMRTADDYVLEREAYWKRVLLSREFGHNRN